MSSERAGEGATLRVGVSVALGVAAVVAGATPWVGRASAKPTVAKALESAPAVEEAKAAARLAIAKAPLTFEENRGQTDANVRFVARAQGGATWLLPDGAVFGFATDGKSTTDALRMRFVGGAAKELVGLDPSPTRSNYIRREATIKGVPNFGAVACKSLYPGVDLRWYGSRERLEYDVVVAPGADPSVVRMAFDGADSARLTENGDLAVAIGEREFVQRAPVAYQTSKDGAREPVDAAFALTNGEVALRLGAYDRSRELVVDPTFVFGSFVGGSQSETGNGAAYDNNGTPADPSDDTIVVCGATTSVDFPSGFGHLPTFPHGLADAYVAKLRFSTSPVGTYVSVSTYIGGKDYDEAFDVALDPVTKNVWLCGQTFSSDFPIQSAFQPNRGGGWDAFVSELDANGDTLLFSSYYGGAGDDFARAMSVESHVVAGPHTVTTFYVTGFTGSQTPFFPPSHVDNSQSPYMPTEAAPFQPNFGGGKYDAFVLHFAAEHNAPFYGAYHLRSSYLGGSGDDRGYDIALNRVTREPHVAGYTTSNDFPHLNVVPGSLGGTIQNTFGGSSDAFVTRLGQDMFAADPRVWSTYLGGVGYDWANGIDVDDNGDVAVTGRTDSYDLPRISSFQPQRKGPDDAFVAHLRGNGYQAEFLTYFGGGGSDTGNAVAFQRIGSYPDDVYVFGTTSSNDLPTTPPGGANFQNALGNNTATDCFIARFGRVTNTFGFPISGTPKLVTYLGGNYYDYAGNATWIGNLLTGQPSDLLLVGTTKSADFPTTTSLQPTLSGDSDAFVVRFSASVLPTYPAQGLSADARTPDSVALSWTPNSADATGFEVQRVDGAGSTTKVATLPVDATSYVDTGLAPDTSYSYTVAAVKSDGALQPSNFVQATTLPYPPAAPADLSAVVSGSTISLSWTDKSSDETGFEIQRSTGDGFVTVDRVAANVTHYERTLITTAQADASWRVVAVNRGGTSAPTVEVPVSTAPTLTFSALKGSLLDAPASGADRFTVSGKVAGASSFDPNSQAVRVELGAPESRLVLTIPAADRGWSVKRGVFSWNSAKSFVGGARATLSFDSKKGSFSLTVSAFDFPAAPAGPVFFGVALGDKSGGDETRWTAKGSGRFVKQ